MTFVDIVKNILSSTRGSMTPQEIRELIKKHHPEYYGTPAHIRNVAKGHYKDFDHALLANIYTLVGTNSDFICNRNTKPLRISLKVKEVEQGHLNTLMEHRTPGIRPTILKVNLYEAKVKDILENADKYHQTFYEIETFSGPSLYFHQRALAMQQNPCSLEQLEYIYATLAAWGMHRMGKAGAKMKSFDDFYRSIGCLQARIVEAKQFNLYGLSDEKWLCLEGIFKGIHVMRSGTTLVGNSKVMHHILPNIVPPIDRSYTLWFLHGNTYADNDLSGEWLVMKRIISDFFIPVASNEEFLKKAGSWMERKSEFPWDTSILKIIDNLIISSKI